jgi:hypothetical protein
MTPPIGRTTPSDAVTITTSKNTGKAFARRIPSLAARTQPRIPHPQPWKPSRVQRRHRASYSRGQLLHAGTKQLHLHAAKAARPPSLLSPTIAPSSLETGRRRARSRSRPAPRTASPPACGPTLPPRRLRAASTAPAPWLASPRAQAAWPPDPTGAHADASPRRRPTAAPPAHCSAATASDRGPVGASPPARPHVAGHQQHRPMPPPRRVRICSLATGSGWRRGGSVALTTPTSPAPASFLMQVWRPRPPSSPEDGERGRGRPPREPHRLPAAGSGGGTAGGGVMGGRRLGFQGDARVARAGTMRVRSIHTDPVGMAQEES